MSIKNADGEEEIRNRERRLKIKIRKRKCIQVKILNDMQRD